ncbi:MAG: molybdopterin oxidoreductase family protein [Actinobacteria bacterium]|nr:molybdopterin oxidoreductase family protein [Actinomycetota bacterium]
MSSLILKRSVCPHDCPDTCGLLVHVRDGRIEKIEGDPDHPVTRGFTCSKVRSYIERVYGPNRILTPMKRRGPKDVGPTGFDQFEPISWDEAIETIADHFREIIRRWGPESILPFSYAGTEGVVNIASMDRRFFYRLGASRLERTICSSAGSAGWTFTMGERVGVDPLLTERARFILIWGANSAATNIHQMALARKAHRNGAKLVVVDVHRNHTAAAADEFYQVLPGSDAALALGMMHVIVAEGLHDEDYVGRHTVGFDQLKERLEDYPPERVARITGLAPEAIAGLAREYASTRPSFIRIGNGLQHHDNGGMAIRTIACLPAIMGAWKDVGGGALHFNSGYFALNERAVQRPALLSGNPRIINMCQLGKALTEADPPVKALFVYNSNPAAVVPNQKMVLQGLARDDLFTVVHEQVLTDTCLYADIILPATTFLEHTDLYKSYWHQYLQLAEPVIPRVGEAKPNIEVFSLLARAMGFAEECFGDTTEDVIRQALDFPSNEGLNGVTLERLKREGRIFLSRGEFPFGEGKWKTPSGKIELYSEAMARDGYDPLPAHVPLVEGPESPPELKSSFPLTLINPPNHGFLNSTFGDSTSSVAQEKEPVIEIHPEDAGPRGIESGDLVRVWNDRGECYLRARVADTVLPGVLVSLGVWWASRSPRFGNLKPRFGNLNQTTPDRLADMGGGATIFSNLVQVEKAGEAETD